MVCFRKKRGVVNYVFSHFNIKKKTTLRWNKILTCFDCFSLKLSSLRANRYHGVSILIFPGGDLLACYTYFCSSWQLHTHRKAQHPFTNFLEEVVGDTQLTTTLRVMTAQKPDPPLTAILILQNSLSSSSGSDVVMEGSHIGGPFLLYRRNNRLRIFLFIFFSGRAKEERQRRLKRKTVPFGISYPGLAGLFKEPLRCGFKRNSLCGTGAGMEPSMEETLQCVSARGASNLACSLNLGVGKGNERFAFVSFWGFLFCFFRGRISWRHTSVWACFLSDSTNILQWFLSMSMRVCCVCC